MDFFKLLKTKPETILETISEEIPEIIILPINDTIIDKKIERVIPETTLETKLETIQETVEEIQFKKGENISIIYMKNSQLNHYKGYNGVIRDALINSDYCTVMLEALNSGSSIRFSKNQVIKWCPYTNKRRY